jgi:uncharacterized membrane protein YfcA
VIGAPKAGLETEVQAIVAQALRFLPICVAGVGVVVHLLGLFGVDPQDAPLLGHVVMLLVDAGVLVGLWQRRRWGHWLALCLFGQQTVFQAYWASAAAASGAPLWQAQLLTPVVCLACLMILVLRRELFRPEHAGRRFSG